MGQSSGGGRATTGGNTPHPNFHSIVAPKGGRAIVSKNPISFKGQPGFAPASSGGSKNPPSRTNKLKP